MPKKCEVSVIIPAYNEVNRIADTIDVLHSLMTKWHYDFEIIVGDDGSNDGTADIVAMKKQQYNNLSIVSNANNSGKGAILKKAFIYATGDIQLFIDADLAISPKLIPGMIEMIKLGDADIVITSKHLPTSKVNYPFLRRFLSKSYAFLAKLILDIPISDFQCGLKVFKRSVIDIILPKVNNNKFLGDTELVARAYKAGYKIEEVPATVHNRGSSKVYLFSGTFGMFKDLLQLRKDLRTP